jgi:MFS family permease
VTARGAYREILAIRDARRLISASAVSQLGDWLFNAALLGTVFAETGSARWVGAATICRLVPYVVLGPLGGVVADRYDRRTVLLLGDLTRGVLMVALAAVVETNGPVALLLLLTALASSAGSAERPASMALLPRLVGEARLGPANALLHTVQDLGVVVGPAIGAVLLAVGPNSVAFLVNGLTFAASAALIWTIRRPTVTASAHPVESARVHLVQGFRSVRTTPFVVPLLIVIAMVELTYGAQTVQLVVYAARRLDLGASGYGYLLAAGGAGGLISAAVNPRLTRSNRVSGIVVVSGALFCGTQLAYAESRALHGARRDADRRRRLRRLRGGRRDRARPCRACRIAGRLMGVEAVAAGAMVAGALLASLLLASISLRSSSVLGGATWWRRSAPWVGCAGSTRSAVGARRSCRPRGGRGTAPDHGGRATACPRTARLGVAVLSAPDGVDVVVEARPPMRSMIVDGV